VVSRQILNRSDFFQINEPNYVVDMSPDLSTKVACQSVDLASTSSTIGDFPVAA
jgi:hypothetical protein